MTRGLVALALWLLTVAAQAQGSADARLTRTVCEGRAGCQVESTLPAGRAAPGRLYVVRVRVGPIYDEEEGLERSYEDWLVAARGSSTPRFTRLRQLTSGDSASLEHELSRWTYEGGLLVFHYGAMGPYSSLDGRPMPRARVYLTPWPLTVVRELSGDAPRTGRTLPSRGPLFVVSMGE